MPHVDISIIASDEIDSDAFTVEAHPTVSEVATTGAITGGAIGALIAGLTVAGTISTGGAGLLVAGPIVAALAGGSMGVAVGASVGALVGLAIPEHELKAYEDALKRGSVLVGVESGDGVVLDRVETIFEHCNATKISTLIPAA